MKRAFTLTEVLIVVSIIGIVSAVLLPNMSRLKPDENKMMFLKTYDAMTKAVSDISSNSAFYPLNDSNPAGRTPLSNTGTPATAAGNDYSNANFFGDIKFCNLVRDYFDGNGGNACDDDEINFIGNVANYNTSFSNNFSFTTDSGRTRWYITPSADNNNNNNRYYTIAFDVNGADAPNSFYNANNIETVPDRFAFGVTVDGNVFPLDPYSELYIRTRTNNTRKSYTANDITETYDSIEGVFDDLIVPTPSQNDEE